MINRRLLFALAVTACGTLPVADDGGTDGALIDGSTDTGDGGDAASATDANAGDASLDVKDATTDPIPPPDAPYVDFDAATVPWAVTFGTGQILSVAADKNQNAAAAGYLMTAGVQSFFVEVLDASGVEVFSKNLGLTTNASHIADAVAFDDSGNLYVAGYTSDALNFGGGAVGPGAVIVKYDSSGAFQWTYGPFVNTGFTGVAVKSNGNVLATGHFSGSRNFGGGLKVSAGGEDIVLLEVSSAGTFVRAKTWGGTGDDIPKSVAVDYADDVFMAGEFASSIDFGGGVMNGPGAPNHDLFVAKLDATFAYLKQFQCKANVHDTAFQGLSVDWAGNVFLAANVWPQETVNFGGANLSAGSGQGGAAIGRLDNSLSHQWSAIYVSAAGTGGTGVTADPTGGATLIGDYAGGLSFGLGQLPIPPASEVMTFATQFALDGGVVTDLSFMSDSGADEVYANAVSFVAWPDVVMGGQCYGHPLFPSGQLACNGHAYAARFKP